MYIIIVDTHEEWRQLIDDKIETKRYLVSSYGRIFDIVRKMYIKTSANSRGYIYGKFKNIDGSFCTKAVHIVVARTFVDGYSPDRRIVNHFDSNKTNNYYKNLEWTNSSGNNYHRFSHGGGSSAKPPVFYGEKSPQNVYPKKQIHQICEYIQDGLTNTQILNSYGFKGQNENKKLYSLVYDIRNKRVWTHVSDGYVFNNK